MQPLYTRVREVFNEREETREEPPQTRKKRRKVHQFYLTNKEIRMYMTNKHQTEVRLMKGCASLTTVQSAVIVYLAFPL